MCGVSPLGRHAKRDAQRDAGGKPHSGRPDCYANAGTKCEEKPEAP